MSRPPDVAFETLCEVCGTDWQHLTANERGRTNAALKQLRDLETELSDETLAQAIRGHAAAYKQAYSEIPLTPTALASNWSLVIPLAKEKAALNIRPNAPASGRDCPTCGGDKWVSVGLDERGYDQSAPCPTCTTDAGGHSRRVDRAPARSSVRDRDPAPDGPLSVSCALCGEEIFEQDQRTMKAQEITWQPATVHRKGGGIHDRGLAWKRTGALAHERCVDALAKGRLNQEGLFPPDQPGLF